MKNFDSILGDVKENAKSAAAAVSQQAAKIYDASKQRISAETIKRSIGKKLIELGKLTYKATTQNEDLSEDIALVVEEITELKQNLALVNEHIAAIKNQKICPDCGAKVSKQSVYCNICGHKFDIPEEPVSAEEEVTEAAAEEKAAANPDDIVVAAKEAVEEISEDAAKALADADDTKA